MPSRITQNCGKDLWKQIWLCLSNWLHRVKKHIVSLRGFFSHLFSMAYCELDIFRGGPLARWLTCPSGLTLKGENMVCLYPQVDPTLCYNNTLLYFTPSAWFINFAKFHCQVLSVENSKSPNWTGLFFFLCDHNVQKIILVHRYSS